MNADQKNLRKSAVSAFICVPFLLSHPTITGTSRSSQTRLVVTPQV
jgi:hypothetical protein